MEEKYDIEYNITDFKKNIEIVGMMLQTDYLKILNIFIENKKNNVCFYIKNNKNELVKNDLNQVNFNEYILKNLNSNTKNGVTLINIYILNCDADKNNDQLNIKDILGFTPNNSQADKKENDNCSIIYIPQFLTKTELYYYLITKNENVKDVFILISYNKYSGYQVCISENGKILYNNKKLNKINNDESLEYNIQIISDIIKEYEKNDNKISILIEFIDMNENGLNTEKIENELKKNLDIKEEKNNCKIIGLNQEFYKEMLENSHLIKLNN